MSPHGNLLGPEPVRLPVDPAAAELADGADPATVAAARPTSSLAWAVLAERALAGADAALVAGLTPADIRDADVRPVVGLPPDVTDGGDADGGDALSEVVAAYAYARTGYHRGLDQLRRSGWRGAGPVPWSHEPNRGFLRALAALARAAAAIGEDDEAKRCADFLRDADPTAPVATL